ncbi:MAG: succinylglutamate desuccinylase/aspartoacylase family protein [Candidatus Marinimicrobia bacterium]|nr:succinylglutamate desuccinylase/aspartoacylase family protein [Candidatus Neomarinimicrobiota bacterium]
MGIKFGRLSFKFLVFGFLLVLFLSCNGKPGTEFPQNHLSQNKIVTYDEMTTVLKRLSEKENIVLESAGKSIENRDLWLLNIKPDNLVENPLKVFLFAQQHGNEPAGKEAIIWLAKYLADNPDLMDHNIDLWLMPMVNPDGAEKKQRRNASGADLNRDHLLLSQPETQTLYQVWHKIQPHLTVDCHEFNRTSQSILDKGLEEWPLIMMDCGGNPLIDGPFYDFGVMTLNLMKGPLKKTGYNFCRYYLGGMPPHEENRFSTLEGDDARNGMALLNSLSFIIESGVMGNVENPAFDLGKRVDAYLIIFKELLNNRGFIFGAKKLFRSPYDCPVFLPTNYFWGKIDDSIDTVMFFKEGKDHAVPTGNFMKTRIIKSSVKMPDFYIIPASKCEVFEELFIRHKIEFVKLEQDSEFNVESVKLLRIETQYDDVYNRYEGRQITELMKTEKKFFQKGSILVDPHQNEYWKKVFYLLEPCNFYGLYGYDDFSRLIEQEILPVFRGFFEATG